MKCLNWLRKIFKLFDRIGPPEPVETPPFPKPIEKPKAKPETFPPKTKPTVRSTDDVIKVIRQDRIRKKNLERRTKFSHAEHFKQRQPTTARKLWKPNAKVEEEEN